VAKEPVVFEYTKEEMLSRFPAATTANKRHDVEQYNAVKMHLSKIAHSSKGNIVSAWRRLLNYLKESDSEFRDFNPDQLLEYQREYDNDNIKKFEIVDELQVFANTIDVRLRTKRAYYSTIVSTFKHNRVFLPPLKVRIRAEEYDIITTLTSDDIRLFLLSSDRTYQAVFLCRFQSGMDWKLFEWWNKNGWEDLQKQLETAEDIIRIEIPGRSKLKNPHRFHTYIGPDAIAALRNYIPFRQKVIGEQYIFYTRHRRPVSYHSSGRYWRRHMRRIGIMKPKAERSGTIMPYGVTKEHTGMPMHEMRDVFRTRWRKSGVHIDIAEFMMGHKIDPLNYDKACQDEEWTALQYRKVLPWLNLISEPDPDIAMKSEQKAMSKYELKMDALIDELALARGEIADLTSKVLKLEEVAK